MARNPVKGRLNVETNPRPGERPGFNPQHFDEDGHAVDTSHNDPLPTAGYGMTEGGVWIPRKVTDEGHDLTQLTGSIVELHYGNLDVTAGSATPTDRTDFRVLSFSHYTVAIRSDTNHSFKVSGIYSADMGGTNRDVLYSADILDISDGDRGASDHLQVVADNIRFDIRNNDVEDHSYRFKVYGVRGGM